MNGIGAVSIRIASAAVSTGAMAARLQWQWIRTKANVDDANRWWTERPALGSADSMRDGPRGLRLSGPGLVLTLSLRACSRQNGRRAKPASTNRLGIISSNPDLKPLDLTTHRLERASGARHPQPVNQLDPNRAPHNCRYVEVDSEMCELSLRRPWANESEGMMVERRRHRDAPEGVRL